MTALFDGPQVHAIVGMANRLILGDREEIPAFFAEVAAQLEPGGPGSRFPVARKLIDGEIPAADAEAALAEFDQILAELGPVRRPGEVVGIEHATHAWLDGDGRFISQRGSDLAQWLRDAAWMNVEFDPHPLVVVFPQWQEIG